MNEFFKKGKIVFFFSFFAICVLVLLGAYLRLAIVPSNPVTQNPPVIERGAIVDRHGVPLAVQSNFYRIGVTTKDIKDKEEFAEDMADVFDLSEEDLFNKINKKNSYVILAKKVTQDQRDYIHEAARECGYSFVNYEKIPGRVYPSASLASHLIGYMGDEGKGLSGIEFSQQNILSPVVDKTLDKPEQGKNIYLTIDSNLQYKLEQLANETMEETQAESMMLIAADCKSGEILSYISLPSSNLNEYGLAPSESKINRPVNDAYEPGSVFKIFTVAIAHSVGGISYDDKFLCDGAYERKIPGGETIRIKCLDHHGWLTASDALKYSCNDVLGQISDKIDDDEFIDKIKMLGFGSKTGIEMSGETSGFVKETDNKTWSGRSKATIAIGQEISVSAVQMVQAATSIANNGTPVKLSVINKITDKEGSVIFQHEPQYKNRIFSKATADYLLNCMEITATTGTGSKANLSDVSIGVKTGTAQMADKEKGGYSDTDFLSNCIAIFPVEDPQIVLYIVVQKAKGETYAGRIVAPVIAKAADLIINHMGMSRGGAKSIEHDGIITIPPSKSIVIGEKLPDFTGYSVRDLLPLTLANQNGIKFNMQGSGWVVGQSPAAGTEITENMVIELTLEP